MPTRVELVLIGLAGVVGGMGLYFATHGALGGGSLPAAAPAVVEEPAAAIPLAPRPSPDEAISDYYILLRQGMVDAAWARTTTRFQTANYPNGYPSYFDTWNGSKEIEVLAVRVASESEDRARVSADLHDTGSDLSFSYSYQLEYDAQAGLWRIDTIQRIR